jgi:hypothetical protein
LLPDQRGAVKKGKPVDLGKLPAQAPDHVLLYLGKADMFPYRIEFRRGNPNRPQGEPASNGRSLVTMELFEVDLNASILPTHFLYSPGDLEYSDKTGRFLKSLDLAP